VLAVTDAVVLSTLATSVLMVIDAGRTRRVQLKQAVQRLREAKAGLVGVVLNRLSPRNEGYLYYYQNSSYLEDGSRRPRRSALPTGAKRRPTTPEPAPAGPAAEAQAAAAPVDISQILALAVAEPVTEPGRGNEVTNGAADQAAPPGPAEIEATHWVAPAPTAAPVRRQRVLTRLLAGLIVAVVTVALVLAYFATTALLAP
jgi:hypothetical protein